MENLMYLKSGTDIRGTALSKDGGNIDLTDSRIESIIFSFVHFIKIGLFIMARFILCLKQDANFSLSACCILFTWCIISLRYASLVIFSFCD